MNRTRGLIISIAVVFSVILGVKCASGNPLSKGDIIRGGVRIYAVNENNKNYEAELIGGSFGNSGDYEEWTLTIIQPPTFEKSKLLQHRSVTISNFTVNSFVTGKAIYQKVYNLAQKLYVTVHSKSFFP